MKSRSPKENRLFFIFEQKVFDFVRIYNQIIRTIRIQIQFPERIAQNRRQLIVIRADMLAEVQINDFYSPAIYMIEQRKTGNYPTDYRFCLSGEYPYLLESATTVEKEDTMYKTTVSSKKFYYVFCSSENPTDLTTEQKYTEQHNKIMTIVLFSLICITILVFIVSITKLILSNTKKH